jgi:hypothetical protein
MIDRKFKINGYEIRSQRGIKDFFRRNKNVDLDNLKLENIENCAYLMGFDKKVDFKKIYDTLILFSNNEVKGHKLSFFIREVGSDNFCPKRYVEYLNYRKINKSDSNSDVFWHLKFGKKWKYFRDELYKNRPSPYDSEYISEKFNITLCEAEKRVKEYKKNKATSLSMFIERHGEELGKEKFKQFQLSSKHTREKFVDKFGKVEGNKKWDEYIDRKKKTSKRSVEYWLERGYEYEQAEELRKEFHRLNFNTSSVEHWVLKGFSEEEAKNKVQEIFNKKTVKFARASKESLVYFNPLKDFFNKKGKDVKLGVEGSCELSVYDKEIGKLNFYDFSIPDFNLIIEYHGERYHPNPEKLSKKEWDDWRCYVLNNKNNFKTIILTADEKYELDQQKKRLAIDNGYSYLELWSSDSKEYNWEKIKKFLKTKNINYEN